MVRCVLVEWEETFARKVTALAEAHGLSYTVADEVIVVQGGYDDFVRFKSAFYDRLIEWGTWRGVTTLEGARARWQNLVRQSLLELATTYAEGGV